MEPRPLMAGGELRRLLGAWRGPGPGYAALAGSLRSLVLDGRLPVRARLPSERELAGALGVSRTTTAAAYDLLRGEGFVESRRGSGSRVALPTGGAVDRELGAASAAEANDAIDMTIAALPAPGATMEAVGRATRDLAGRLGGTGYERRGLASFRRAIVGHFEQRGLPTDPDQVVVTAGAQHALALLLDVLVAPGDPVLVEVPSYPNAFEAMRRAGVRFLPAPMADRGWDVETIAARFREGVPRLAYLIPDFQNPTGFLMGDAERAAVVAAAARAGTHVVVDETFAALGRELPGWRFTVPRGGLCLWAELERPEAEALAEAAQAEGVRIVPGPTFGVGGTLDRRVRLPFTQPPDRLEEAVTRLAAAECRLRAGAPSPAS